MKPDGRIAHSGRHFNASKAFHQPSSFYECGSPPRPTAYLYIEHASRREECRKSLIIAANDTSAARRQRGLIECTPIAAVSQIICTRGRARLHTVIVVMRDVISHARLAHEALLRI